MNMSARAVRYELWQDDVEGSLSFFPEDSASYRSRLGPEAKLVWSCTAESWEQAQSLKHEHLGWEPYKPSL
nr:putative integron gene cassette protein [uncultured bacterium]